MRLSTVGTLAIIELNCFKAYDDLEYILIGKFTMEDLEKRFGIYCTLAGCNYNVSFDDILSAEKNIRTRRVFKKLNASCTLADLLLQFSVECTDASDQSAACDSQL